MSKDNMPKEKMVYFRTSLGGFNREDVNSYIEKLNGEFAERERTAKRKTDALESKLAELQNPNWNGRLHAHRRWKPPPPSAKS